MNGSEYRNVCLTCTSAMELGIDIGDLDRALSGGRRRGVSSLLQRWGRTGRRAGRAQETTLYTPVAGRYPDCPGRDLAGPGGLGGAGHPAHPGIPHPLPADAQPRAAGGGLTPAPLWTALQGISAFRDITQADFTELLTHLLATGMLADVGGTLVLGDAAERQLGRRRFQALITSFDAPDVYTVVDLTQRYEVGQLESWFVDELQRDLAAGESRPVILLTGRAWQVQRIHLATATIDVLPDRSGQAPKWQSSSPRLMHRRLAWRHRELLLDGGDPPELDPVATAQLQRAAQSAPVSARGGRAVPGGGPPLHAAHLRRNTHQQDPGGAAADRGTQGREQQLRDPVATCRWSAECGTSAVFWRGADGIPVVDRRELASSLRPLRLSKYQPYLPEWMGKSVVADHLLDFDGTQRHLAGTLGGDAQVEVNAACSASVLRYQAGTSPRRSRISSGEPAVASASAYRSNARRTGRPPERPTSTSRSGCDSCLARQSADRTGRT